ncbi:MULTISPECIES: stage V sporulation protein AD [Aneurinibacillus]|jgi:stage V sporulation protein AD|uniref:Stage V sporulation protein AD n=1 Tax=Aneurinibacillus thermoaerophilus TaxID=143495 RepID=A0A1G8D4W3_ANETH|nr:MULTISPECIES: stage V sporulation protein AD [Aneurinibacillus]AMA74284.1 stage V sporulation protein AD [Aneurinibacillus sp. XH2]MED0675767.1 stage V sporulation protein AD [Aneurinibacillus thermoaerophilus]MED0680690.1 stage V sporulation protein AD [Aneurinibacillus thermoaerophilus]MED0736809.1 stage V sporulation protein AD [Aneurinibacillus thermoaerophilus]MED0758903.1 stage V sporulation protein AD [Aneurinibacillus thermoaerophilus]
MLQGHQSWVFTNRPVILASATVGGPFEAQGKIAEDFDLLYGDIWLQQDSFEKAEKKMMEDACDTAIKKAGIQKGDINFFIAGDLMNQIISSSFSARTVGVPYLGIFGACSTSMEGLALAAQLVDSGAAKYAMAGTCSHNATAEKQFRYPTEYGSQKPPTAQWTVTGAGVAIVAASGAGPRVTAATVGRVVDMGITDPFNMGAAMAPAAVDTITAHFRDLQLPFDHYDLIATGDLGQIGHSIAKDLFAKHEIPISDERLTDCGLLIYNEDQQVIAGGSGCACCATVTYGHLLRRLRQGEWKRILVVATGALLSPLSFQQNETIPCIAHAVAIEQ